MDTSQLPHAKGVTAKARIAKVRSARQSVDRRESAKVKVRSGGRCEVIEAHPNSWSQLSFSLKRCQRAAIHVHHLLSGRGVRARGASALQDNKLAVCGLCHADIHDRRLVRADDTNGKPTYRRVKSRRLSQERD